MNVFLGVFRIKGRQVSGDFVKHPTGSELCVAAATIIVAMAIPLSIPYNSSIDPSLEVFPPLTLSLPSSGLTFPICAKASYKPRQSPNDLFPLDCL